MKNTIKKPVILILLISLFGFAQAASKIKQEPPVQNKTYIKIWVDGLACPFCAYGLEKKIKKLPDVSNLFVDLNKGFITFIVTSEKIPSEKILKKLVKEAGFVVRKIQYANKAFIIKGKTKD